ncbi:MAG: DUF4397 domain-containing protein [Candidatus Kapaibacterium sp.]
MRVLKLLFFFALATATSLGLSSCEEDTTQPPVVVDDSTDMGDSAEILFMQAVPAGPGVDLLIDDRTVITNAAFGDFGTSYSEIEAGSRQVRVFPTGTTTPLVDTTLDFTKDHHYTIFAVNNVAGTAIDALLFTDNLIAPAPGKAHIRIAHLVPDGSKIKFSFRATGQGPLFNDVPFMGKTEAFIPVDTGGVTMRVHAVGIPGGGMSGSGPDKVITPDLPFTLEDGGIYTIAVIGTMANDSAHMVVIKHEKSHE